MNTLTVSPARLNALIYEIHSARNLIGRPQSLDNMPVATQVIAPSWHISAQGHLPTVAEIRVFDTSAVFKVHVLLTKLNSRKLSVVSPIPAILAADGDEYTASLVDADVSMSGATFSEALWALRDFIEHLYGKIGPGVKVGPAMETVLSYIESHVRHVEQQFTTERSEENCCQA